MPTATQSRLGIMIREIRERAGLTQEKFAYFLNLTRASVQRLEAGTSKLLSDRSFYKRLRDVPGFTDSDVTNLLLSEGYASDWFDEINQREYTTYTHLRREGIDAIDKYLFNYPSANLDPHEPIQLAFGDDFSIFCGIQPDRKRRYLVIYVTDYDTIRLQTVFAWMENGELLPGLEPEQQGDPSAGQGTNTPESGLQQPGTEPEQRQQAPNKGEVYKRPRSHYDSDYLRENARHIVSILGDALENDDPVLSPDRKQALHVVVESIVKKKGASLNKVSHEKHIPHPSLADWVRKGLVPVLYRDKRTIYLANEIAEEVSHDYQDTKEMNYSAARLLRERREKYFPVEAAQSRT